MIALRGHPLALSMRLLFAAMGDVSWRVRKEAVSVLTSAEPAAPEVVEGLISLLRASDNAGLRNSAVESLERLGGVAVEPLCRYLDDPDQDLRKFVIDILGSIRSPSSLPFLVKALEDPDTNVRLAAAENLGKLRDPAALPHLLRVLEGEEVWLKFTVLDALALIGVPVPLSSLAPLLEEKLLRRAIYDCLGALGDAEAVPVLLQGVQEKVKTAREAAAVALVRVRERLASAEAATMVDLPLRALRGTPAAEGVISSLKSADAAHLEALVRVAGLIGDRRGTDVLLRLSCHERLRGGCLQAFRAIGEEAIPELLALFSSEGYAERAFVAFLLGELGCREAVELLTAALNDQAPEVRAASASALGRLAATRTAPKVGGLLDDKDAQVSEAALESLQRLAEEEPAEVAPLCAQLAQSELPRQRRQAALLLATLADGERLSLLAKDEDPSVRRAAVASLSRVKLPQSVGHLAMALADEDPEVRVAAAQALSEAGGEEVLEPLLLALNDPDPWVQSAALKGLSSLGNRAALSGVRGLLSQARGPVLIAALSTLAAIGGEGELPAVKQALSDGDEEVVEAAIGILSGFGGDWIAEHHQALIGHPHWVVRRSYARAAAQLLEGGAIPLLDEALAKESDPQVKGEIAGLIGRLGHAIQ